MQFFVDVTKLKADAIKKKLKEAFVL